MPVCTEPDTLDAICDGLVPIWDTQSCVYLLKLPEHYQTLE